MDVLPAVFAGQSASDRDPRSASNRDPLVLRFGRLALVPSELVGVAETGRARVGVWSSAQLLKRQLSLPVSMISQRGVRRSSSAVVILASLKTLGHSPKARFVVTPADEVKQELPAGLGEGQIAEFVEDDEVHARQKSLSH